MIRRMQNVLWMLPLLTTAAMAQAQAPAITRPGVHHKQLDTLAGDWNVAVRYRYGNGPERESAATCTSKWILNGHYLEQQYQSGNGMGVLQILGYDNQKKKFFEVKFDNQETGVLRTEGTISEDGKVITNIGDRADPLSGQVNRLRTVTTITDHDHYTPRWSRSPRR